MRLSSPPFYKSHAVFVRTICNLILKRDIWCFIFQSMMGLSWEFCKVIEPLIYYKKAENLPSHSLSLFELNIEHMKMPNKLLRFVNVVIF